MSDKVRNLITRMLFGSHLYGLSTPKSDKDYKGIFIPDIDDILLGKAPKQISKSTGKAHSKNTAEDIDEELFSLVYFVHLASKGETVAIDMLHTSETIVNSPEWKFLVQNREKFYTKNMKAYIGYVTKQAAKYGVKGSKIDILEKAIKEIEENAEAHNIGDIREKLPLNEHAEFVKSYETSIGEQEFYQICGRKFQLTNRCDYVIDALYKILNSYGDRARKAKENNGIDWKAISHALRAGYQAYHIYKDGTFSYPLPETDFLYAVKQGELDFLTEVQPVLENLVDEVKILADKSDYPEKVDMKFWENWLLKVYKEKYF